VSDHPSQTRSFRSGGSIRSRSASELLLDSKRPSFLASRRFAPGYPDTFPMTNLGETIETGETVLCGLNEQLVGVYIFFKYAGERFPVHPFF